ncbi:methyltransferase domain-containing protein [Pseudonocardia sp.]|uniref:class I SAM-dependent methyltransferase n=1 Tax=Pseudonocardia sp. TaxID=60912 RepID=UPI0031FE1571
MTTNEEAIRWWGTMPRADVEAFGDQGDFSMRHLLNAVLLRMLGDVRGRRVLDAGCGTGYLSRLLPDRGAEVVGVEPARALIDYARLDAGARVRRSEHPTGGVRAARR